MDWMAMLKDVWELCVIPLLGILTVYIVNYIKAKNAQLKQQTDNDLFKKYMDMLETTIVRCVIATNQTYTEALKQKNAFDADAQKEAFQMTYDAVLGILSEDAVDYLKSAVDDFELFITQLIEAEVNNNKKPVIAAE